MSSDVFRVSLLFVCENSLYKLAILMLNKIPVC